jgi:hypothetical protein
MKERAIPTTEVDLFVNLFPMPDLHDRYFATLDDEHDAMLADTKTAAPLQTVLKRLPNSTGLSAD